MAARVICVPAKFVERSCASSVRLQAPLCSAPAVPQQRVPDVNSRHLCSTYKPGMPYACTPIACDCPHVSTRAHADGCRARSLQSTLCNQWLGACSQCVAPWPCAPSPLFPPAHPHHFVVGIGVVVAKAARCSCGCPPLPVDGIERQQRRGARGCGRGLTA